ncbi:MAG: hypothetical protein EBT13_06650 [Rhodobacteraceae bacterium]|nr:hypothetical protein [Paracoccaceae bacterium]
MRSFATGLEPLWKGRAGTVRPAFNICGKEWVMLGAIIFGLALLWDQPFVVSDTAAAERAFVVTQVDTPLETEPVRPELNFYTQPNCGPCKTMEEQVLPVLEAAGWKINRINIREVRSPVVSRTPTSRLVIDGKEVGNWKVGVWSAESLQAAFAQSLPVAGTVAKTTVAAGPKRNPSLWRPGGDCYESRDAMIQHLLEDGIHRGSVSRQTLEGLSDDELSALHESQHRAAGDVVRNGRWQTRWKTLKTR